MIKIIRTAMLALSLLVPVTAFAGSAQYQLTVDGLACPFCAYGIEKELKRTQGVQGLDIDINSGIVTVTMAEGATMTEAKARQVVKDAGFTLRNFEKVQAQARSKPDTQE